MKSDASTDKGSSLIGVERTARILQCVADAGSANLTEIARGTALNEATVLRYLNSLVSPGFIERFNATQYRLGWEMFRLGRRAYSGQVPTDAILPTMEGLQTEFNETVNFAVKKDRSVVIIEVVEGRRSVKKATEIKDIRERGFAIDGEEAEEELTCVAAAIPTTSGEPSTYALSVSFLTHRLTEASLEHAGRQVVSAAREIAAKLP